MCNRRKGDETVSEFISGCAMSDYSYFMVLVDTEDAKEYMYEGIKFNGKRKDKRKFIYKWIDRNISSEIYFQSQKSKDTWQNFLSA